MEQFKIRGSAGGDVMTGDIGLTEGQAIELVGLFGKEKLTPTQEKKIIALVNKRDNPTLPKVLTSYCEKWLKEKIYQKRKGIHSKYFDKGNVMENASIEAMSEHLDLGMIFKNEDFFEDDFFTGTPDVILSDEIIDMKNSWDQNTFPLFDKDINNKNYYYQLQIYMHLTGKKKARLVYYLSNTPENLIEREAKFDCLKRGYTEVGTETYEQYYAQMTYDDVEPKMRIKVFEVEYNEVDIKALKDRVEICRKYIKTLLDDLGIK